MTDNSDSRDARAIADVLAERGLVVQAAPAPARLLNVSDVAQYLGRKPAGDSPPSASRRSRSR